MIDIPKHLTRTFIREHKEILFVFGDNLMRRGEAGQAAACRYQKNAAGIPTKRMPCVSDQAWMDDRLSQVYINYIEDAIQEILNKKHLYERVYVIPWIGEGLAELPTRAPIVFAYLIRRLEEEFQYVRP